MVPRRLVFVLIYLFFLHSPPVSAQTTDALDCPLAVSVNPRDAVPHSELRDSLARAHPIATGAGVRVAVVDTGVAPHPRLPTLIPGGDLVGAHMAEGIPGEFLDCDGHGTIVAGIIAARAKQGSGWP